MNPEQLLQNFPEVKQLMSKGLSYEQIFRQICKQRGINADEFVKQLQQQFNGFNK